MDIIKGDLITMAEQGQFDVIVHGCNCFTTMGKGIARTISVRYPAAFNSDRMTTYGDYNKLGNFTKATVKSLTSDHEFDIINAYTQFNYRGPVTDLFEYEAFALILKKLKHHYGELFLERMDFDNPIRFGFPWIGCGLAGGNKTLISSILNDFSKDVSINGFTVTVVEYEL